MAPPIHIARLDPTSVCFDDGARDRKAQPHAVRLGAKERIEECGMRSARCHGLRRRRNSMSPLRRPGNDATARARGVSAITSQPVEDQIQHTCCRWTLSPCDDGSTGSRVRPHPPRAASFAMSSQDFVDRRVQIEGLHLHVALAQRASACADDFACTDIVLADVVEDLPFRRPVGFGASSISAASALLRIAPSGWLISCAMEAVSSPARRKPCS